MGGSILTLALGACALGTALQRSPRMRRAEQVSRTLLSIATSLPSFLIPAPGAIVQARLRHSRCSPMKMSRSMRGRSRR